MGYLTQNCSLLRQTFLRSKTQLIKSMELLTFSTPPSGGVEHFPFRGKLLAKTLLIMRLTTIFLLATALQISAKGLSQKISITGKKLPLEKVFASIEEQSGYSFIYKYNDLLQARPVDLHLKNADIRKVMDACLKEQHLTYTIEKNIIAIRRGRGCGFSYKERIYGGGVTGLAPCHGDSAKTSREKSLRV